MAAPWLIVPEDGLWSWPVVLLVCFFLFGVELINPVIEEPFGRDRNDLDLDRYCRTIREGVEASLPLSLKARDDYAGYNAEVQSSSAATNERSRAPRPCESAFSAAASTRSTRGT